MLKPRQVLGMTGDGKLVSLHLSEDVVKAKAVFCNLRSNGGEGYAEILLSGPYGPERHHKFHPSSIAEVKPVKAVKVAR
jgi:hypothetical protein